MTEPRQQGRDNPSGQVHIFISEIGVSTKWWSKAAQSHTCPPDSTANREAALAVAELHLTHASFCFVRAQNMYDGHAAP